MNPNETLEEIGRLLISLDAYYEDGLVAEQIANVEGELYELRKIVNSK